MSCSGQDPSRLAEETVDWLRDQADATRRAELARYGIPDADALGIQMRVLKAKSKALGRNHALAQALWATGLYEARTLAAFVAEPDRMDPDEADAWVAAFDNWAICDTACFHFFDRTPFAWTKPALWAPDPRLYVRRAGFALIWALALHDKRAGDEAFLKTFPLMRSSATDDRPHVKKAVNMALRALGQRNAALNEAARTFAAELEASDDKTARWIGAHAGRALSSGKVLARL